MNSAKIFCLKGLAVKNPSRPYFPVKCWIYVLVILLSTLWDDLTTHLISSPITNPSIKGFWYSVGRLEFATPTIK